MSQFIEDVQEKHRIQQVLAQELKEIIIEYLQPRSGKTVGYWSLHDTENN